jgi:hypothetical protein
LHGTAFPLISSRLQIIAASQQHWRAILLARQYGGRRLEPEMEIAGIVMLGSVLLYLLQQIEEAMR